MTLQGLTLSSCDSGRVVCMRAALEIRDGCATVCEVSGCDLERDEVCA